MSETPEPMSEERLAEIRRVTVETEANIGPTMRGELLREVVRLRALENDAARLDYLERKAFSVLCWRVSGYHARVPDWEVCDNRDEDSGAGDGSMGETLRGAIDWSMKRAGKPR